VDAGAGFQLCSGDSLAFNASGQAGYSYQWSPSNGLSSDTLLNPWVTAETIHDYVETQQFVLTASDGYCQATDSVSIQVAPAPVAWFALPPAQCFEGNSFEFQADGVFNANNASFQWNMGPHGYSHNPGEADQHAIVFDAAGSFPVSLTIAQFGCISEPFVDTVQVNAHPTARLAATGIKGCVPLQSTFDGAGSEGEGLNYFWNFGDGNVGTGAQFTHEYTQSGSMSVSLTVVDQNGCSASASEPHMIVVLEQPVAGFRMRPNVVFIGADALELTSLSQNALYSYYIIGGDTILGALSSYSFTEEGTYDVTQVVVNAAGCEDSETQQVRVEYGTEYYIPTAFTPNNDGHNDVFKVEGSDVHQFNLIIFDRWGQEIFSTTDIEQGWDGRFSESAEPAPEGVYIYRMEMRNKENHAIEERGSVTLFR
jgi:gliding motility-associated-like protein